MNNQLRVWHSPQIPGEPFYVDVSSPDDAKRILNLLGEYDAFQYEQNIKPDYSNVGGLEILGDDGIWVEWEDEDGSNINDLMEED